MTNPFTALQPPKNLPFLGMMLLQEGACPYLESRRPTLTAIGAPEHLDDAQFSMTLEIGMRRSGSLVYRPICEGCRKCFPLRIVVSEFAATHSQKRVFKRCEPLFDSEFDEATLTLEKVELYQKYQAAKHNDILTLDEAAETYERFLVQSCAQTRELRWRTKEGKLVGVGVLDLSDTALSSVYFYWDPAFASFSLGVFSVLKEIELAKSLGLSHYYLGYFVPGSTSMEYKAQFGPAEIYNGKAWEPLAAKESHDPRAFAQLETLEEGNAAADTERFDLATSFQFERA